jgi:hypothetical protein
MMLRTVVRDCLFLNWALPVESLPEPPAPLRYQLHSWQGGDHVFASALLFHHNTIHLSALPRFSMTYPQLNLRLYVLDQDGQPAILFRRMLMPLWLAPGVRLMTHQPVRSARLDFPRPSRNPEEGAWRWRVERGGTAEVQAWPDSPRVGEGPKLGNWEQTVRYFTERTRGYAEEANGSGILHRIDAEHPPSAVWPLRAEVQGVGLFRHLLSVPGKTENGGGPAWPSLHSTWLCPEIPFVFELGLAQRVPLPQPVLAQPAAGRVAAPVVCREGHEEAEKAARRDEKPGRSGSGQEGRRAAAGAVLASAA